MPFAPTFTTSMGAVRSRTVVDEAAHDPEPAGDTGWDVPTLWPPGYGRVKPRRRR